MYGQDERGNERLDERRYGETKQREMYFQGGARKYFSMPPIKLVVFFCILLHYAYI